MSLYTERLQQFTLGLICSLGLLLAALPCFVSAHSGINEEFEDVIQRIHENPSDAHLYLMRGNLYLEYHDASKAIADFQKALQLDPGNNTAELGVGRAYLEQGLFNNALKYLNRLIVKQPDNVRGLVTRAETYRQSGEFLMASRDYTRAIEAFYPPRKPLPEYYLERARSYVAAGDKYIDEALNGLDDGLHRLGNIQHLELYAIELERRQGNLESAIQRLDRILERSVRKESLLLLRGDILLVANRNAEAEQNFLAAQAAIAALPPRHRHTRTVQQLETAITVRLQSAEQQDDHAQ